MHLKRRKAAFRSQQILTEIKRIELFNTDGALGAARGAALGAGYYHSREEAFASLRRLETVEPVAKEREALEEAYGKWVREVEMRLERA